MIVTEEFLRKHNLNIDSTVTVAPANVTIRRNEMKNNDPDQSSQYSGIISDPRNTYDTKQSKPEWVGLEKEEIEDIWKLLNELNWSVTLRGVDIISHFVEIKLKEKNT